MAALLSDVTLLVQEALTWIHSFIVMIVGGNVGTGADAASFQQSDLLILFVVALPLVGLGVGLLRRLIHTRG